MYPLRAHLFPDRTSGGYYTRFRLVPMWQLDGRYYHDIDKL